MLFAAEAAQPFRVGASYRCTVIRNRDRQTPVAVITGATKGIGRAVTDALAARHWRIGCIARSRPDLEALQSELGAGIEIAPADVGDRDGVEAAIKSLTSSLGTVDVLVNNAGVGLYGPVVDLDPDEAERIMRINYLGTVYATCAVLPAMVARHSGQIVNVASIAGRLGAPLEAAYSASKFAVVGFSEALQVEVAPFGVKVSLVNPGPVDTEFFEARGHLYERSSPRPVPAADVATAVLAAIDRGRFETVVPRSLRIALTSRAVAAPLYFYGLRRAFRPELARLAQRLADSND